jgi:hypothetical protein
MRPTFHPSARPRRCIKLHRPASSFTQKPAVRLSSLPPAPAQNKPNASSRLLGVPTPLRPTPKRPKPRHIAPAQNEPISFSCLPSYMAPWHLPFPHAQPCQSAPNHSIHQSCKTNPTPSALHDKFKSLPYNPPLSPARAVRAGNLWYGRRPSVEAGASFKTDHAHKRIGK